MPVAKNTSNQGQTQGLKSCYLPSGTSSSDLIEYQACLASITHILDTYMYQGKEVTTTIAGDFNVDTMHHNNKKTLQYLKRFMTSVNFLSVTQEQLTFQLDDGKKRSSIDGFLIPSTALTQFRNISIREDGPLNISDHYLVTTTWSPQLLPVSLPTKVNSTSGKAKRVSRIKIKWDQVDCKTVREYYTLPLVTLLED